MLGAPKLSLGKPFTIAGRDQYMMHVLPDTHQQHKSMEGKFRHQRASVTAMREVQCCGVGLVPTQMTFECSTGRNLIQQQQQQQ